jgi:S1-C subfamily serine protease
VALIPPANLDVVAAVGVEDSEGEDQWIGTAFLYNRVLSVEPDRGTQVRGYPVTNRHVVESCDVLTILFNPRGLPPTRLQIARESDDGTALWAFHPDPEVDVAVTGVLHGRLKQLGLVEKLAPLLSTQCYPITKMKELQVVEGDGVFVVGFPLGIVSEPRSRPIVRSGCIARIQDVFDQGGDSFLVDAQVFPGNSGGPVFRVPSAMSVTEDSDPGVGLLGIVYAYAPYSDVAVSPQTGKARVIFQENSGLAYVHTVDCIDQTVAALEDAHPLKTGEA